MPLDFNHTWREPRRPGEIARAARRVFGPVAGRLRSAHRALSVRGVEWRDPVAQALAPAREAARRLWQPGATAFERVAPRLRFRSLAWRIFTANLLGLVVMLAGIMYLSQHQAWLIDAKRESLLAQGEIIANAIAASATGDAESPMAFDPDRLMEPDASHAGSLRPHDVDLARLELPLLSDRSSWMLHRFTTPNGTRARIYGKDGDLVHDSRGPQVTRRDQGQLDTTAVRVKDFWTRLDSWFVPANLPLYKEIGSANGKAYAEVRMALQGAATPMLLSNDKGNYIVAVAVPIQRMTTVLGVLLLSTGDSDIASLMRKERHIISWVAAIALAATALSSFLLAGTIAGPMRRLSAAAEDVTHNIKSRGALPTFPDRKDEIAQMAASFANMTSALYRRIERSEKFAADVAHELKNPIAAVQVSIDTLGLVKTGEQRGELMTNIRHDLKRLDKLITDIWNLSIVDPDMNLKEREPVDVAAMALGVADVFNELHGADAGTRVVVDIAHLVPRQAFVVLGHDIRLGQVITNLVDNAISFSPADGRVWLRLLRVGAEIEIAVEDQGPGIPQDKLETIFERFYTDRPESETARGKNSGLGLSISQEIVEAHGGRIWAENRSGGEAGAIGARFVVRVPAADRKAPKGAQRSVWLRA